MSKEFKRASELINSLFEGFNENEMKQSLSFVRSWKEIVGEKISAHSKVLDLVKGSVVIEVDHPGWSQQILLQKKRIITSLSKAFPELDIRNLMIRVISEYTKPYVYEEKEIGKDILRIEKEEDVTVREDIPEELKDILEKLKNSIKKGKPK
ncbi:MAG TPA: DUF721 domain-containing protein [Treponemataceae bacterium]|nr:DUF721 domain-containing protein [Treponemataceae bacterium]